MDPTCVTRALKNARYIQSVAPHIIPAEEPPEGFASLVPFDVLSRLHQMSDAELQAHPQLLEVAGTLRTTLASRAAGGLFSGVVHFVQVTFNVAGTPISVSSADMATVVQYAVLAAAPISAYASQYGHNRLEVSTDVLPFSVDVPTGKYNDQALQGWVNSILTQHNLPSGSSCIVILNPKGVTNTDGDATKGVGGYHGKANSPYCLVNVFGSGFTLQDLPNAQAADHYALVLSHELAEMAVDPNVDGSNPEVCDPCGPNCGKVWRDYFFGPPINSYQQTSQMWPPNFQYGFFLNAIVQPNSSSKCPAPESACDYAPPAPTGTGQLVFYEPADGVGEFWATNPPAKIGLQRHYNTWRGTWSSIIGGAFSTKGSPLPLDLLFYDPKSGVGEFYQTDRQGNISLLGSNSGWRTSWSLIIPGKFSDGSHRDLLFYDRAAGVGEFWRTDGHGHVSLIGSNSGWRSSWSLIIPGKFSDGNYTDLLFYDPKAGAGEFWRTDGHGHVSLIGSISGWRTSWSLIVPGHFSGGKYTDLLFYDPTAGVGEFWRTDGHGHVSLIGSNSGWRTNWSLILPGNFSGGQFTDLLFYERAAGVGEFWRPDGHGNVSLLGSYTDWRTSWSLIAKI